MENKTYKITLTEKQMSIIQMTLEEYFRLRMGQAFDFSDDVTRIGINLDSQSENFEENFNRHLVERDFVKNIMEGLFKSMWYPYGVPQEKTDEMMIAETIWDTIRCARGISRWGKPLHQGSEPIPNIEVINDDGSSNS